MDDGYYIAEIAGALREIARAKEKANELEAKRQEFEQQARTVELALKYGTTIKRIESMLDDVTVL
jgi:hypothetical protein